LPKRAGQARLCIERKRKPRCTWRPNIFCTRRRLKITHVPYKGTGPALNDTIGGSVQMILGSVATALQHVKSGRLRALAVHHAQAHRGGARRAHGGRVGISEL